MDKQEPSLQQIQRNESLIKAARTHNLQEIQRLIKEGAHINYIQYTDSCSWYSGNTHTPLSVALEDEMKCDETNFNNVIQCLLQNGANANFQVRRGFWNHSTTYPIYNFAIDKISGFKTSKEKLRLITMLKDTGMNLNLGEHHERSKNHRGYQINTCFIFNMMDQCKMNSKLYSLKKMKSSKISLYELQKQRQKEMRANYQSEFNFQEEYEKLIRQDCQKQTVKSDKNQNSTWINIDYTPVNIDSSVKITEIPQVTCVPEKEPQKQNQTNDNQELIFGLIQQGVNPNSSNSSHHWQCWSLARTFEYDEDQMKTDEVFETLLHRAIMCNSYQIVNLLIEKGAKLNPCKFTIDVLQYPNEWPTEYKMKRKIKNENALKDAKAAKMKALEQGKSKQSINDICFRIYKHENYIVDGDLPRSRNKTIEISPVQIAELLNVDPKIINLLKSQTQ